MTVTPRFLDEIKTRLTLSDIIGQRVSIRRAGREFKACCPFHHEKTPSFTINDDKQFYHCFGCGAHGDAIGFVMHHDNLSFIEAVEMLAAQAGLQIPAPDPQAAAKAQKEKSLYELLDLAAKFFSHYLHNSAEAEGALKYLQERGIRQETLEAFRVGYAPADGQRLKIHLLEKDFTEKQLIEAGVVKVSDHGQQSYSFFRERIMFPVADRRGRVVAFGGRILPDHLRQPQRSDFTPPKYINSSDTPVFDKGRMLYGESLARQNLDEDTPLLVTEGYMDVIACHQAGFTGAVAPMGTALTEDQLLTLWGMIPGDEKLPVLCFDGDDAGRRAASRACERILPLLKPGHSIRFVFLPEGEDPDSLLRQGKQSRFRELVNNATSLFDFIWLSHTAGRKLDMPEQRAGIIRALENEVQKIADRSVQVHYKALLKKKVSDTFFPRAANGGRKRAAETNAPFPSLKIRRPVYEINTLRERIMLATFINYPELYNEMEEVFSEESLITGKYDHIRRAYILYIANGGTLDSRAVATHLLDSGLHKEVDDILNESVYVHAVFSKPGGDINSVKTALRQWLKEMEYRNWDDVQSGWKDAFSSSDPEAEEKVRQLIKIKTQEV